MQNSAPAPAPSAPSLLKLMVFENSTASSPLLGVFPTFAVAHAHPLTIPLPSYLPSDNRSHPDRRGGYLPQERVEDDWERGDGDRTRHGKPQLGIQQHDDHVRAVRDCRISGVMGYRAMAFNAEGTKAAEKSLLTRCLVCACERGHGT